MRLLNYNGQKSLITVTLSKVTGFEVGSVPLVGLNLPFVIDKNLYHYPFIYGGTGERTCTLKINPQALEELNSVKLIFG
nr:YbaK/EbsC family protein [Ammoniphilus resinae]